MYRVPKSIKMLWLWEALCSVDCWTISRQHRSGERMDERTVCILRDTGGSKTVILARIQRSSHAYGVWRTAIRSSFTQVFPDVSCMWLGFSPAELVFNHTQRGPLQAFPVPPEKKLNRVHIFVQWMSDGVQTFTKTGRQCLAWLGLRICCNSCLSFR